MMKYYISVLLLFSVSVKAQIYTEQDVNICRSVYSFAVDKNLAKKPVNEIIIEVGKNFIGTEYEAFALEAGDKEQLVINLRGLDCYTFLESSLIFARTLLNKDTTFKGYKKELVNVRYRNGEITGYPSRLHYFSDWIYDMDCRDIVEDVTKLIGGIPYENNVTFMTDNWDKYKRLRANPADTTDIRKIQNDISKREYYYIPQDSIELHESKIKSGDIIGITTNIPGLDISHTGIAIEQKGRIHFMHAPTVGAKVQITEKPLGEYIRSHSKQTGIMVARPLHPDLTEK